jgi:hypothetical protein
MSRPSSHSIEHYNKHIQLDCKSIDLMEEAFLADNSIDCYLVTIQPCHNHIEELRLGVAEQLH